MDSLSRDILMRAIREKIQRLSTPEPVTVLDLFAGCGGLSLGFQRAGYHLLGGIEWDPKAAATLAANFSPSIGSEAQSHGFAPTDITKLPPTAFHHHYIPHLNHKTAIDLVIGGPPCQAFARIGRAKLREIMRHPKAFLKDIRANLYLNFLEYVAHFAPLGVVMENVQDIMNFGGTNVAEEIASSLEELGYQVRYTVLNSVHYGVPQMRQRFFLLALHSDLHIEPSFPQPTNYHNLPHGYDNAYQVALSTIDLFNFQAVRFIPPPHASPSLPRAVGAQEALGDLALLTDHLNGKAKRGVRSFDSVIPYRTDVIPSNFALKMRTWPGFESTLGVSDHVTRYLPRDFKIFRRMEPGDQYPQAYALAHRMFQEALSAIEQQRGHPIGRNTQLYKRLRREHLPPYDPGKFPNKWRKMEPDKPSRTLTAHIGKDTYSHIHYDSAQARVISVREAARLQSFPDGFTFEGPMNNAFRQIGNAVPPLLAYAMAKHIASLLKPYSG